MNMWLSRAMRTVREGTDADLGVTTISGGSVGVVTRGEVRSLPVYGPGGYVWLQLMFGICQGDIRISAYLALLLGVILWESAFSRFARPVFSRFWGIIIRVISIFCLPCKT